MLGRLACRWPSWAAAVALLWAVASRPALAQTPEDAVDLAPLPPAWRWHGPKTPPGAPKQLDLCACASPRGGFLLRVHHVRLASDQKRLTLFGPQLLGPGPNNRRIRYTPPLLPLSLPLSSRAFGLLLPRLQFLAPPYPTLDVPVFLPLGQSADATVQIGFRSDWRFAPRFGLRVRARPHAAWDAMLSVEDTWDIAHQMAARRARRELRLQPRLASDPIWQAIDAQRRTLGHRVRARAQLRGAWGDNTGWSAAQPAHWRRDVQLDADWVGDDLVLRDLSVAPAERSAAYLPSRLALRAQHPWGHASLWGDAMLNLQSVRPVGTRVEPVISNWHGGEANTWHRLPSLQLQAQAPPRWGLVPDVHVQLSRYGPLSLGGVTDPLAAAASQIVLAANASLFWARATSIVHWSAQLRGLAVLVAQPDLPVWAQASPMADVQAHVRFWRAGTRFVQQLCPYAQTRGLWVAHAQQAALSRRAQVGVDEWLQRRTLAQTAIGVRYALWQGSAASPHLGVRADASLPIDWTRRAPMQAVLTLSVDHMYVGQLRARLSVLPARFWAAQLVREADVAHTLALGAASLSIGYTRLSPNAERLQRTLFDLRGPELPPDPDAPWVHTLRVGALLSIAQRVRLSGSVGWQLPRPATPQDAGLVLPVARPRALNKTTVSSISVRAGYRSLCRCFSSDVLLSAAPRDFVGTLRLLFVFEWSALQGGALPEVKNQ